ncbi:hypothetical protein [Streptomyces sp. NPDC047000]|uniref:hypothetical protein n=1 Tax=Streptomyces sp. NPDC047000 TaxID=3155474 RepID=UPI0033CA52C7
MTSKTPSRNQEPEPVRRRFARLFRRRPTHTEIALKADLAGGLVAGLRQAQTLAAARAEAARWKRHADDFAREAEDREKERDGAYRERAQLLAWLTALHPATSVITASPDVDEDGWQLLYLVAGGWQMSWHIHPRDADLFRHVTVVDVTDPQAQWDGHGTVQKYERIRNHVRLLVLDEPRGDEAVTGVSDDLTATVRGLKADCAGFRGLVLHEVWEALRDAENGPLTDGMTVVNRLMERAQHSADEQEQRSA